MKKPFLCILLALSMLLSMGCAPRYNSEPGIEPHDLSLAADINPQPVEPVADLRSDAPVLTGFGLRLLENADAGRENALLSPLSVLYALGMTANGAAGETLAQMETVLGLPVDTLNRWLATYLQGLTQGDGGKLLPANAIWVRQSDLFTPSEAFLQTNADVYQAGLYAGSFDDTTLSQINNWVSQHTEGRIPSILDQIDPNAVMYLVNALAFEARWETVYREDQVRSGTFTKEDGTQQTVDFLYSEEHAYLETANATGFLKYYEGKDYAFAALLPKEGTTVAELVASLNGEDLSRLLLQPQSAAVQVSIPKFEVRGSYELRDALTAMGMPQAFHPEQADFSNMGTTAEGLNLHISRILHKTYLCLDEQGTKAGAATAVEMRANGAMMEEFQYVNLDRPFVYLLIDCETGFPIFLGTLTDAAK